MSHTPGPWTFEPCETKDGTRYQHVCTNAGYGVADTYHCDAIVIEGWGPLAGVVPARPGNPDDARLIAAAPDLLEAIESFVLDHDNGLGPHVDRLRTAIKKARGE